MTQQDFSNSLSRLVQDYQIYAQLLPVNSAGLSAARITVDREFVYPLIIAGDWSGLKRFSLTELAVQATKLQALQLHQSQLNNFTERLFLLKTAFQDYYPEPQDEPYWVNLRAMMETQLLNAGVSPAQAGALLSRVESKGGLNAYNSLILSFGRLPRAINYAFESRLALYMYHASCIAYADFNLSVGVGQTLPYSAAGEITNLATSITTRHDAIFQKVQAENLPDITTLCNNFDAWLTGKMQNDIIPIVSYCHQQRMAANANLTSTGELALEAGKLFQNALFSRTVSKWLVWTSGWHEELKIFKELFAAAGNLVNVPIPIQGSIVAIGSLASTPQQYNQTAVIVKGLIQNSSISHLPGRKVLSLAEVVDSGGAVVKIVLPHFKLDSGGMVDGAYAEVSGEFLVANPEANALPAVSVDRLALKELAKTNWSAWLRDQVKTVFQPVAHSIAANFSLEPGSHGAVNPVKFDTSHSKPSLSSIKPKTI